MKRFLFLVVVFLFTIASHSQTLSYEPEFVGQIATLLPDGKVIILQKEATHIKTSSSKFGLIPVPGSSLLDKSKSYLEVKGKSSNILLQGNSLTFVYRAGDNSIDPVSAFGIISLNTKKKSRQFMLAESGTLSGTKTFTNFNNVPSTVKKQGKESYLITISDIKPGQYAFVTGDLSYLSTFCVE